MTDDGVRQGTAGTPHGPYGQQGDPGRYVKRKAVSLDALWREDATFAEVKRAYQYAINTGQAWLMEGHVGRTAMRLIEDGYCTLGHEGRYDFYGSYVPSRFEVVPGLMGSTSYVRRMADERRGRGES